MNEIVATNGGFAERIQKEIFQLISDLKFILPVIFLFSGYIYEASLLGLFGIDVDGYFSTSEYLSACLSQTTHIVFSIIIGFLPNIIFQENISRIFPTGGGVENKKTRYFVTLSTILLLILIDIFFKYYNFPWSMLIIPSIVTIIILNFKPGPVWIFNILFFLITSCLTISESALGLYEQITGGKFKSTVIFNSSAHIPAGNYAVIAHNEEYFFIYDNEHKKTIIVPSADIDYLSFSEQKNLSQAGFSASIRHHISAILDWSMHKAAYLWDRYS